MGKTLVLAALVVCMSAPAFAEPAIDGTTCPCEADAAGALVSDVAAIPTPAPAPTLNLSTLADRLKATSAIGFFGKLAVKGRVDALMAKAQSATTDDERAALRPDFDSLMADVTKQLDRGGDPTLAADVRRSSDALWKLLLSPR